MESGGFPRYRNRIKRRGWKLGHDLPTFLSFLFSAQKKMNNTVGSTHHVLVGIPPKEHAV